MGCEVEGIGRGAGTPRAIPPLCGAEAEEDGEEEEEEGREEN